MKLTAYIKHLEGLLSEVGDVEVVSLDGYLHGAPRPVVRQIKPAARRLVKNGVVTLGSVEPETVVAVG